MDITEQSYEVAKDLLADAFDRKINSKYDIIKNLSNLKLNMSDDPYVFAGSMRSIISSSNSMNLTVEDFLTYFIWNSLNTKFQDILINICNKSNPSLNDIKINFF